MLCWSACKAPVRDTDLSSSATGDVWRGVAIMIIGVNKQTPVNGTEGVREKREREP